MTHMRPRGGLAIASLVRCIVAALVLLGSRLNRRCVQLRDDLEAEARAWVRLPVAHAADTREDQGMHKQTSLRVTLSRRGQRQRLA